MREQATQRLLESPSFGTFLGEARKVHNAAFIKKSRFLYLYFLSFDIKKERQSLSFFLFGELFRVDLADLFGDGGEDLHILLHGLHANILEFVECTQ